MRMRTIWTTSACLLVAALFVGCDSEKQSAKGFRLPEGSIEKGQAAFVALKCNTCHSVAGSDIAGPPKDATLSVVLGGEVRKVKTYGQLVTSIINPSHELAPGYKKSEVSKDGVSKMSNFNEIMTVQQLVDLVAFLQSMYSIKVDDFYYYPYPGT